MQNYRDFISASQFSLLRAQPVLPGDKMKAMINAINSDYQLRMFELGKEFRNHQPFPHLVLDNFFQQDFIRALMAEFPRFDEKKALNELGVVGRKAVHQDLLELGDTYRRLNDLIQSKEFLELMSAWTDIPELLYDPEFVGGGTHENLNGQELDPHVDFNYHPGFKWHRRLNLLIYLNPEWESDWGGSIELHSEPWKPESNRIISILPLANRAVIFETSERSWHGFRKIAVPENRKDVSRRSIALYFYTKDRPDPEVRPEHGTFYVHRPVPERFLAGYRLEEGDRAELEALLQKRDDWIRFLYDRELNFSSDMGQLHAEIQRRTDELRRIYTSYTYRMARMMSWPIRIIRGK